MTATTTNGSAKLIQEDEIKHVQLSDIYVDHDWNNRSHALTLSQAEGTETKAGGLDALKLGLFHDGQDEAVILRSTKDPNFYKPGVKEPWALVAGFRRYQAIDELNKDEPIVKVAADAKRTVVPNTANGTIRAVVRKLAEAEAVALNLRENTQRNDMSTPDLVRGAMKLGHIHQRDAKQIATTLGVSPSYAAQLLRIGSLREEILAHWRAVVATNAPAEFRGMKSAARAGTSYLDDVSKADKERQIEMYTKFIQEYEESNVDSEDDAGDAKKAWFKAAKKKAVLLASLFGRLGREQFGEGKDAWFVEINAGIPWVDMVDTLVKPGKAKGFEARQRRSIGDAMEKAYAEALEGKGEEEEEEEVEEPVKGKETPAAAKPKEKQAGAAAAK
jgi:ParB-like chromosome segregation protein Spo0J